MARPGPFGSAGQRCRTPVAGNLDGVDGDGVDDDGDRVRHRLVLLADTHVPARARDLPAAVWDAVAALGPEDLLVHAGDWVDLALLDRLTDRLAETGTPLLACWGNNDGQGLRERLPEVGRAVLGGVRFAVVHETGAAAGRDARLRARFGRDTDVVVFGHSHIPWDTAVARPVGGPLRLLNPGSPTDRRRQPAATYLTAAVGGSVLTDIELHRLPIRTAPPADRRTSPTAGGGRVVPRGDAGRPPAP